MPRPLVTPMTWPTMPAPVPSREKQKLLAGERRFHREAEAP
jgi:hypothetical protein